MSILVFRLETKDKGYGPWCDYGSHRTDRWSNMGRIMPSPNEDGIYSFFADEYRHGCIGITQLKEWFAEFVEDLQSRFCIRMYQVPDTRYRVGGHQVIFCIKDAVLVEEWPVEVLAN